MASFKSDVAARVPFGWEDREPLLELDFAIDEFERRIAAIQQHMASEQVDALIAYGGAGAESNVRYLSGFPSWWGDTLVVMAQEGDPALITNSIFHGEPMHSNIQKTWIRDIRPLLNPQSTSQVKSVAEAAADFLEERRLRTGRIGIADTRRIPMRIERALRDSLGSAEIVDGGGIIAAIRRIKSDPEIDLLRRLGRATSAGMDMGLSAIRPGVTESAIAAAVHAGCISAGVERMDFGCFSIAGERSFMKNVWPRPDKQVRDNELVVIDIGAQMGGYQSDMSRNAVAGEPTPELRHLLEACLEAEETGLEQTFPGATIDSVLKSMSSVISQHGFGEWDWSTGHGYGLDIVEEPYFFPGNQATLEPGMCFYIEPMIVPTDVGTICTEDMVVVTEDGHKELTVSSKHTW